MTDPNLDVAAARARFDASQDLTVGVEEEFAILDPETLALVDRYEQLRDAAKPDALLAEAVAGELISSEIEIRSGRGEDVHEALHRQRALRGKLFALAAKHGVALGATGTHPLADYRDQNIIDTPHYRRLKDDLRWVAQRNTTFSLHVHIGVNGADRAIHACDRLRPLLPVLLAISANSPYIDGLDSGLHSGRTQVFTRTFPRCGVPDQFGSWDAWAQYVDFLVRTGSIVEYTQVWWSVRPHHAFGTVEVRICDAQMSAQESDGLVALIVACVAQVLLDEDNGLPLPGTPARLIEENLWRAIRYGRDGRLLDLVTGEAYEAAAAVDRLIAWTAPARALHGLPEPILPELNGAQRQRRLIQDGASPREVFAACVDETRATYARHAEEVQ